MPPHNDNTILLTARHEVRILVLLIFSTLSGCGSEPQATRPEPRIPLTLDVVKNSFKLNFPHRMTSVQIADNIFRGAENPRGFAMRFKTDLDGFDKFRNSIPQQGPWTQLTSPADDPRASGSDLPEWFNTAISQGICCRQSITGPHQLRIDLIVADTADPAAVTVYIEGLAPRNPAWSLTDIKTGNVGSTRWMLSQFADRIDATFPSWTTIIKVRQLDAAYRNAWLKLSIPSDGLEAFIDSSPFAGGLLSETERFCTAEPDMPWWDPEKAGKFLSARTLTAEIYNTSILISLDEQDFATVYIHCVETNAP